MNSLNNKRVIIYPLNHPVPADAGPPPAKSGRKVKIYFKNFLLLFRGGLPADNVFLHNLGNRKTLTFRLKTPFLISPKGERMI
jgi:hypothetical protein